MKIPTQRIEAVVAKEESRYALEAVLFDAKRNLLVATNGHALAAIPSYPCKGDETGLIPLRGWQLARAAAKRIPQKMRTKVSICMQVLKHRVVLRGHDETTVIPKLTGQFPEWETLFGGFKPTVAISINVDLLAELADALTNPNKPRIITLFIQDGMKMLAVAPEFGEGVGLLMPIRSENHDFETIRKKVLG